MRVHPFPFGVKDKGKGRIQRRLVALAWTSMTLDSPLLLLWYFDFVCLFDLE